MDKYRQRSLTTIDLLRALVSPVLSFHDRGLALATDWDRLRQLGHRHTARLDADQCCFQALAIKCHRVCSGLAMHVRIALRHVLDRDA